VATRTGSNATPFTFCGIWGYFKDIVDKLLYIRARFHKPSIGRWLNEDPFTPVQAAYLYASDSPAVWTDPSGYFPWVLIGCIVACVISIVLVWAAIEECRKTCKGEPDYYACLIQCIADKACPGITKAICIGCLLCICYALRVPGCRKLIDKIWKTGKAAPAQSSWAVGMNCRSPQQC
jgi:RHS repeat-associated protein